MATIYENPGSVIICLYSLEKHSDIQNLHLYTQLHIQVWKRYNLYRTCVPKLELVIEEPHRRQND